MIFCQNYKRATDDEDVSAVKVGTFMLQQLVRTYPGALTCCGSVAASL